MWKSFDQNSVDVSVDPYIANSYNLLMLFFRYVFQGVLLLETFLILVYSLRVNVNFRAILYNEDACFALTAVKPFISAGLGPSIFTI